MQYYVPNNAKKYDNVQNEDKGLYRTWAAVLTDKDNKKYIAFHTETYYWEGSGWEDDHVSGPKYWEAMPKDFYQHWHEVDAEECSKAHEASFYKFYDDDEESSIHKKEDSIDFETFWSGLKMDAHHKKYFKAYIGKKKVKHLSSEWYDLYIKYLKEDDHLDANTELYDFDLRGSFPIEVYETSKDHYLVLNQPSTISNSWHFVKRYKRSEYAMEFVKSKMVDTNEDDTVIFPFGNGVDVQRNVPTTDIKVVMKWLIDDKSVVYRPIHPGIPDSEAGDWVDLDPDNPNLSNNFEYQLADRVQHKWEIDIPKFEIIATSKEDALAKAEEYFREVCNKGGLKCHK